MTNQELRQSAMDDWRSAVTAVLRRSGRLALEEAPPDVERLLSVETYDGIRIDPLYTADDVTVSWEQPGVTPFTRGSRPPGTPWEVRQRHDDTDPQRCATAIRNDVAGGVDSVWLSVGPAGIPLDALPVVLEAVDLRRTTVVLDAGPDVADAFAALCAGGVAPSGNLGLDPALFPELALRCATELPGMRAVTVDATVHHDAGGSDADELGCALAAGVTHLRALVVAGLRVPQALGQMEFRYAATADQFLTIAKLRAARRLWARVAQLCGAPEAGAQRQHAVTSSVMMTARDPWTNMLRTTVAAFSAAVGGADAITVQPYDSCLGVSDEPARRLARNTLAVLREEAHLGRVADPAGGSWYVESLTDELAQRAWQWFTDIERAGGMAAALASGLVAERLAATWERRAANLAHGVDRITGVSEFPDVHEVRPHRLARSAALPLLRHAAVFEALRDRVDRHTEATGARPVVLLVPVGAAGAPETTWATNHFAVAGLTAEVAVATDADGVAEALIRAGTTVACLCGGVDDPARTAELTKALSNAGATRIWATGKPSDRPGVDGYLHRGCDVVDALRSTLDTLEVAE
ncbi:methylmalonyl-CoA mutase subunit beta [Micromonospora sp. NPDC051196]|uniref:methylmalonyl-CoA mutase subunit beta n=1 Tax=Micromonospora sp. NPDC051196 TaxID=3155281 RepID=UPI003426CB87